jgi:hypothetical protein
MCALRAYKKNNNLKDNCRLTPEEIETSMKSIKTTMHYENQDLTTDEIELCKDILAGNCTGDEAREMILKQLKATKLPTA